VARHPGEQGLTPRAAFGNARWASKHCRPVCSMYSIMTSCDAKVRCIGTNSRCGSHTARTTRWACLGERRVYDPVSCVRRWRDYPAEARSTSARRLFQPPSLPRSRPPPLVPRDSQLQL
jgi:hypothetical protein